MLNNDVINETVTTEQAYCNYIKMSSKSRRPRQYLSAYTRNPNGLLYGRNLHSCAQTDLHLLKPCKQICKKCDPDSGWQMLNKDDINTTVPTA